MMLHHRDILDLVLDESDGSILPAYATRYLLVLLNSQRRSKFLLKVPVIFRPGLGSPFYLSVQVKDDALVPLLQIRK